MAAARATMRSPGRARADDGSAARRAPGAAAAGPRAGRPGGSLRGLGLRQPAAVRRRHGPRPVPARRWSGDLAICAAEGVGRRLRAARRAQMYPTEQAITVNPGPVGRGARRRVPAGLLRRRADCGAEDFQAGPARRGGLRRRRTRSNCCSYGGWWPILNLDVRHRVGGHRARAGRAGGLEPEQLPVAAPSGITRAGAAAGRCGAGAAAGHGRRRAVAGGRRAVLAAAGGRPARAARLSGAASIRRPSPRSDPATSGPALLLVAGHGGQDQADRQRAC